MYPGCMPNHIIEERQDTIFRKVRGILNKITPESFDKLSNELVNVGLDSPRTLRGVIYLLFDKALKDLKYSSLYAKLCQELSEKAPNFEQEAGPNTFCKFLISKCEDEFERRRKATEDFDSKNELTDEEYEQKAIAKLKMLGNIKFICELGKKRLLQEEILHECIRGLLSKKKERPIQDQAQDFECLCQIMRTIGSLLDVQASRNLMNQYFERIDMFSKKPELPSRIRFMLRDVIDLRNNNWRPRPYQREDNVPQPLSKLREEAGYGAVIAANNSTIDKMGNNKNLLGISDLSKLHGRGLSSLIDDDGPSFTTTTDFHWGPSSFMSLDEQPFDVFNSKSPQPSRTSNTATTGDNDAPKKSSPLTLSTNTSNIDPAMNSKRTQQPVTPSKVAQLYGNNSFNSANSFHKSLTSEFNQQNHSEQRHHHLQAPPSQQTNTMFSPVSNRLPDNNYNRHILTNNSNHPKQNQHPRHQPQAYSNDNRPLFEGSMKQPGSGTAIQQPISINNRLSSQNNQFNNLTMDTRYDDNDNPVSHPRNISSNANSTNNNNINALHQKFNEPPYNGPRRFGNDPQRRELPPPRIEPPVMSQHQHSNRHPFRRHHENTNEFSVKQAPLVTDRYQPPQSNNNNRLHFESSKPALADSDIGHDHGEPNKFRPRVHDSLDRNDPNYPTHPQLSQNIQGQSSQQNPPFNNQSRQLKFPGGPNYRHPRGPVVNDGHRGPQRDQQGYFDKNHDRKPESELNMNWRAKPANQVVAPRREGGNRNITDEGPNNAGGQHLNQPISPVQPSSSSASSATSSNQVPFPSQASAPGIYSHRNNSENKFINHKSAFSAMDKPVLNNQSAPSKLANSQHQDYKSPISAGDSASRFGQDGGFGRRPHNKPSSMQRQRGSFEDEPSSSGARDREFDGNRFGRDRNLNQPQQYRDQHHQAMPNQPRGFGYNPSPPRSSDIVPKVDSTAAYNPSRFNDSDTTSRRTFNSLSPPPPRTTSIERNNPEVRQQPMANQPFNGQRDYRQQQQQPQRPAMSHNAGGEFSDRRDAPRKFGGPNYNRQDQRYPQQNYRQRPDDDHPAPINTRDNPRASDNRNPRPNFVPRGHQFDSLGAEQERNPNWRKDNPPVNANTNSNNAQVPVPTVSKDPLIPPTLAPLLQKGPRSKVSDTNFSLRPSHSLVGRTIPNTKPDAISKDSVDKKVDSQDATQSADPKNLKTDSSNDTSGNKLQKVRQQEDSSTVKDSNAATANGSPGSNNTAKSAARDFHVNKFVAALAEYVTNSAPNANRVASKIKELKIPKSYQPDCLVSAMKQSILKAEADREQVGKLFVLLVPNVFEQAVVISAFKIIFQQMKALEVETPKVKSILAGFLSRALLDNLMSLDELANILHGGKHHPLFLLVLQKLQKAAGQLWLSEKFTASKINLMDMLPEADRTKDRLASSLKDRCLGFLDPMLTIEPDLWEQMSKERDISPTTVYRWIRDNVDQSIQSTPPFAHVLMTCVLKYVHSAANDKTSSFNKTPATQTNVDVSQSNEGAKTDSAPTSSKSSPVSSKSSGSSNNVGDAEKEILTKYQQVLQAILKDKQMQLATLYSVQSFHHGLDFPKGSLLRWFHMLYDLNIVDDDVFFTWKEEINDEFPGKGQALFQVNTWLQWLAEAESEEEEDV